MKIRNIDIQKLGRPFLIAEAAAIHLGDTVRAHELAKTAITSGADALTFQQIDKKMLYTELPSLPVPEQHTVSWECLADCAAEVRKAGMAFSICVTDIPSLQKAMDIGIDFIKIVSYDITYFPFLRFCADTGLPILMSTGASTFEEVEEAMDEIKEAKDRILLYHTDCGYPTPANEINLKRMQRLRDLFHVPVGYCDHTNHGISCLAATALGANAIEKHFSLNSKMEGADYMVSMEPEEIKELFAQIKETAIILGDGADVIAQTDIFRRENLRRSLALARDINAGDLILESDLIMLRPPIGLSWKDRHKVIGKKAKTFLKSRKLIMIEDVF